MTERELVILLIALVSLWMAFTAFKQYFRDRKREYVLVFGTVADFEKEISTRRGKKYTSYKTIIEYYYNGESYRTASNISTAKIDKTMTVVPGSKYKIGDEIELRVFVDEPSYAVINKDVNVKLTLYMGLLASAICVLFSAIAICLFIK